MCVRQRTLWQWFNISTTVSLKCVLTQLHFHDQELVLVRAFKHWNRANTKPRDWQHILCISTRAEGQHAALKCFWFQLKLQDFCRITTKQKPQIHQPQSCQQGHHQWTHRSFCSFHPYCFTPLFTMFPYYFNHIKYFFCFSLPEHGDGPEWFLQTCWHISNIFFKRKIYQNLQADKYTSIN